MKKPGTRNLEFIVDGMDCADCALRIEKKVAQLPGIKLAKVNFLSSRLKLEIEENGPTESEIQDAVKAAGYSLRSASHLQQDYFEVEGLTNTEKGTVIERKLKETPGIKNLRIDYSKRQLLASL
jgi:Cu+-exporting ATPase